MSSLSSRGSKETWDHGARGAPPPPPPPSAAQAERDTLFEMLSNLQSARLDNQRSPPPAKNSISMATGSYGGGDSGVFVDKSSGCGSILDSDTVAAVAVDVRDVVAGVLPSSSLQNDTTMANDNNSKSSSSSSSSSSGSNNRYLSGLIPLSITPLGIHDIASAKVGKSRHRSSSSSDSTNNGLGFRFEVYWSDETTTSVVHSYDTLFRFHCNLLDTFPVEAGNTDAPRAIPPFPGKRPFVSLGRGGRWKNAARALAERRMPQITAYLQGILHLPAIAEATTLHDLLQSSSASLSFDTAAEKTKKGKKKKKSSSSSSLDETALDKEQQKAPPQSTTNNNNNNNGGAYVLFWVPSRKAWRHR